MCLSIDGKLVVDHRSDGFAYPAKRWLSFSAAKTVWIDELEIWTIRWFKVPAGMCHDA